MRVTISPHGNITGTVKAPPSKSMAHRALICAGLADGKSAIDNIAASEDLLATMDCLRALGAGINYDPSELRAEVTGADPAARGEASLCCRESGSTLRFMLPLCALSDKPAVLTGSGRLMERPLTIYEDIFGARGIAFERSGQEIRIKGSLKGGEYSMPGDVSSQFVSGALQAGERLMTGVNPALAGAKAIAAKIQEHTKRVNELTTNLENAVGARTSSNKQRMLTARRKIMLEALQRTPDLAECIVNLTVPVCDSSLCTMCGDCATACMTHALDLDKKGHVQIEAAYCTSCGFCADICAEGALTMEPLDARELIVPDPQAEEIARKKAEAKAEAKKLLDKGIKQLDKVGDVLESLDKDN